MKTIVGNHNPLRILEQSPVLTNPKQYSRPFQVQKRSTEDLRIMSTAEDGILGNTSFFRDISLDKPVKLSKPFTTKRLNYNPDEHVTPLTDTSVSRGPRFPKRNNINNFVHQTEKPSQCILTIPFKLMTVTFLR